MKQILILLLCISSTTVFAQFGNSIKGNGNLVKEERNIPAFEGVSNSGSVIVTILYGSGKLQLEGEENVLPYLETKVENGILKIGMKKTWGIRNTKGIRVTAYTTSLNYLATSGSGSITVNDKMKFDDKLKLTVSGSGKLEASSDAFDKIETAISGSGSIRLAGKANRLESTISGSGDLRAQDLTTDVVDARCSGSGKIYVRAEKEITASISGSGNIFYTGDAKIVKLNKSGSGTVKKV